MEKTTILVGTIGQGVMRSHDGGETWQRMGIYQGMHSDAMVRTLVHHPKRPEIVYAGTDKGLYCSDDAGASWKQQASALSPLRASFNIERLPPLRKIESDALRVERAGRRLYVARR